MKPAFFLDAHLDLALNAIEWNRDLTRPIAEIRAAEAGMRDKPGRGRGAVCLPELRRGRIGLAVVTQLARVSHNVGFNPVAVWRSPEQAWAMTQAQLSWYRAVEEAGEIKLITRRDELERHVALWQQAEDGRQNSASASMKYEETRSPTLPHPNPLPLGEGEYVVTRTGEGSTSAKLPIGCILSLEGADSLVTVGHLERAYAYGLRAVGLSHYGPGRYAQGTHSTGGLTAAGRELLKEMERLGMILDVTHLSDECFSEALGIFSGPVWASHHNCRALVPHQRQLSDEQIRILIERDAVIGAAMDGWMIIPDWVHDKTTSQGRALRLESLVQHIDHICQLAGNARHTGLGSDLDGGFGLDQAPMDIDTVADVQKLGGLLEGRGWNEGDITAFAHGNFLSLIRRALD